MTVSLACAKVGTCCMRRRGSRPSAMARALASARSRAMARVTTGQEPRPRLVFVPLGEMACAQVLDRPPDLRGVTSRLSPRPPYPSPYRPGTLTVLTKVAQRRTE